MLHDIQAKKLRRINGMILAFFLIIALRSWHLEVVQKEEKIALSEQPKTRTIVQKADRGTICDRFHIPLAINKICYNAIIYYNQIVQVPSTQWQTDVTGKKSRIYPRKNYVRKLSETLAPILGLDPLRIEDLIHAKASLLPHVPFLLKGDISEREHFRLAAIEKDWPAVHAEIGSQRFYPRGKVGSEVIGSMGFISSKTYLSIREEIQSLQKIIDDWQQGIALELPPGYGSFEKVAKRFQELKEKTYTIQDLVGKSGIEGQCEEDLRGFYGKKITQVDRKGHFLKEMPGGKEAIPGQQTQLSLSIELQEFAEALLAKDEKKREKKSFGIDPETKERKALKQPWVKGGAIVALDPNTGEVLALASTPRFDPNDFIPTSSPAAKRQKQHNVSRWLENEEAIGAIWDGFSPLVREFFSDTKGFYEEKTPLSWSQFLRMILPLEGPLNVFFQQVDDVKTAVQVQEDFETLLFHSSLHDPFSLMKQLYPMEELAYNLEEEKKLERLSAYKRLDPLLRSLKSNEDRLFAIDLCRLVVHSPAFSDESLSLLGSMKLEQYRSLSQAFCKLEGQVLQTNRDTFHSSIFENWRQEHQKEFLLSMRKKEKEKKISPRPYTDYLDQKEKELFCAFWKEQRLDILAAAILYHPECQILSQPSLEKTKALLHTFRSYANLDRPLLFAYPSLKEKAPTEKHLAASFYPKEGFGYHRSFAFQASSPQGSLFKLVTAYAALAETKGANPLTLIDEYKGGSSLSSQVVATSVTGIPYSRIYKGGRLPKSHSNHVGKVDLVGAIEQSSNPYFSLLAVDVLKEPESLLRAARLFGLGSKTGIELPREASGLLPDDLQTNRTSLYSTAFGQHTLLATPLQTAAMLAAIAMKGNLLKPRLIKQKIGSHPLRESLAPFAHANPTLQEDLQLLGIDFPLFTGASLLPNTPVSSTIGETKVLRSIPLPPLIRSQLLEGMDRAVWSSKGSARPTAIKYFSLHPGMMDGYLSLRHQMVGKTSTAEINFNPNINPSSLAPLYKHIWFGAISFREHSSSEKWEKPELVVVVYLRYGEGGKEAAPLAAQIIQKWRQIQKKYTTEQIEKSLPQ